MACGYHHLDVNGISNPSKYRVMKWRPSSIGKLMTNARSKNEVLSETAKSYIKSQAKQNFYGYNLELNNKYINKGILQEHDSIDLINAVRFTDYSKHIGRVESELMSGECDILLDDMIIDVKTSWSLETFPATREDANDRDYEWQGRAYMHLYDRDVFEVIHCMVSTDPKDEFNLLTPWDNLSVHRVDHIDPAKRITVCRYERDLDLELDMLTKLRYASEFYAQVMNELVNK
jgi:hypothetical protein